MKEERKYLGNTEKVELKELGDDLVESIGRS